MNREHKIKTILYPVSKIQS